MNDINLSEICGENVDGQSVSWTPIGSDSRPYSGTFNGDGHTISGLYIDNSTANNQGLFGCVYGGTVKNLNVSGTVSNVGAVGGIVNVNSGRVENCTFSGSVKGSGVFVGGVVGNNGGTVENCYNTGKVTGSSDYSYIGGVVGYSSGGASVTNCYNTGEVSGGEDVGGVVGYNAVTPLGASSVKNCYNTGEVSGIGSVGGIVGYNVDFDGYSASVENCYNTGSVTGVTGSSDYVGGVVGDNRGTVKNCYFLSSTADVNENLSGIGEGSGTASDVEPKTAKDFHSGEVAWLLENGQAEDQTTPVWGQSNLTTLDSWPTLIALDNSAQPVYKVTFKYGYDSAPEN